MCRHAWPYTRRDEADTPPGTVQRLTGQQTLSTEREFLTAPDTKGRSCNPAWSETGQSADS